MKSSRNHKLFKRVTRHVGEFWNSTIGLPGGCLVALSGGMDSTLLLEVVAELGQLHHFSVRAIHVDHGTQTKQAMIESKLQDHCDRLGVELIIVRTVLSKLAGNFEATARAIRLKLIHENLQPDEVVAFGHHIDDSYEWSLMQKLRSSQLISTLGIPLVNGKKVRPFMCLTRVQIESIHSKLGLWSFEDESNTDERFSRNHLRRVIRDEFAIRYPNYLKHYVRTSNELAKNLGVSVYKTEEILIKKAKGVRAIYCLDISLQQESVSQQFKELSNVSRSSERGEIAKLCKAFAAGKKGPHQLPGKVKAWGLSGLVLLTNELGETALKKSWTLGSHIPESFVISNHSPAPLIAVWNPPKKIQKIALKSHPLVSNPQNCNVVLLPWAKWSRFVTDNSNKSIKLHWQALNF